MQSRLYITLLSVALVMFMTQQVNATCSCAADDTTCLQKCVADGQTCISQCNGDNSCYNNCISDHWPGQASSDKTITPATTVTAVTTDTTAATTIATTTSMVATTSDVASTSTMASSSFATVPASVLSSIASAASSAVSQISQSSASVLSSAQSSAATFTPTPPTSSNAPAQTSGAKGKPFLVPAIAIGVAMVTIFVQFFFLARMGAALFN